MAWIDVQAARTFLKKTETVDDAQMQGFIDSACSQIEDVMGHVEPVAIESEPHEVGPFDRSIILDQAPVVDIVSVGRAAGGELINVPAADLVAGTRGWRQTMPPAGVVLTVPLAGLYVIDYIAGRDPVPPNYTEAALELVGHHWRATQTNAAAGRPQAGETDQLLPFSRGLASALPYRVRELLGLYGNQIRSEVFIA